ncbi:hypothetical protein PM8797T_24826 [Gimesia maris DSM 8797]|nr:hypothetical protein PM8797T_24826 [Gimesia maris DSM 8797]
MASDAPPKQGVLMFYPVVERHPVKSTGPEKLISFRQSIFKLP